MAESFDARKDHKHTSTREDELTSGNRKNLWFVTSGI